MTPHKRLAELDIVLPELLPPKGAYAGYRVVAGQLWVSGHTARTASTRALAGVVGFDVDIDTAKHQARLAAVNLLAAIEHGIGLDGVEGIIHLRGYVRSADDFTGHPSVIDGASELLAEVFGPTTGSHARTAVGVSSLPGGACVELELVVAT